MNHELMSIIKGNNTWERIRVYGRPKGKIKRSIRKSVHYESIILEPAIHNLIALSDFECIPLRSGNVMAFNLRNPAEFLWKKKS